MSRTELVAALRTARADVAYWRPRALAWVNAAAEANCPTARAFAADRRPAPAGWADGSNVR